MGHAVLGKYEEVGAFFDELLDQVTVVLGFDW